MSGIVSNFARYASSRCERFEEFLGQAFFHFRADVLDQAGARHALEHAFGGAAAQDLVVLLEQPRGRGVAHVRAERVDRVDDRLVDRELQPLGHHHGAQHADRIFLEPLHRIADAAR